MLYTVVKPVRVTPPPHFSCVGETSPSPEGWPAPAPRDSELGLPLQID